MNSTLPPLPPQALDAEAQILGAILLAGAQAFDRIDGAITAADFYSESHRLIFETCERVHAQNRAVDVVVVADALERAGTAERAGGIAYLAELAANVPGASNARRYAEIVRERATHRRLLALADQMREAVSTPAGRSADDLIAEFEAGLGSLHHRRSDAEPVGLGAAMAELLEAADADAPTGIMSGLSELDGLLGGFQPGQLVVVAARPGAGKTAFALTTALHAAASGAAVLFHSLEMPRRELAARVVAARSGIPASRLRPGRMRDADWAPATDAFGASAEIPIFIDDRSAASLSYVRATARRMKRARPLGMIVIDYIQLMSPPPGSGDSRNYQVGALSRGLKALAKELDVPVLCLAQLNRAAEGRADRRPQLSDLRDSGEVEQDGDAVVMLHREALIQPNASEWHGVAELMVRKNRQGPTGELLLSFDSERMQFTDYHGPHPRAHEDAQPSKRRRGFK